MITPSFVKRACGLGLVAVTLSAHADLVIEQKMEGPLQSGPVKTFIKGEKIRTDIGEQVSSIVDLTSRSMLNLVHQQKVSMKLKMPDLSKDQQTKPKITPTGQKEKVGDHECEIVEVETAVGSKVKLWVAKDYPGYEDCKKEIETLSKLSLQDPSSAVDFGGMPVKIESDIAGQKTTITLVSLKQQKLDDSLFKAPEGYTSLSAGK